MAAIDPRDLIGTWSLESFHVVGSDGAPVDGPLGPEPRGLLIYGADRHVSVSMMSTAEPVAAQGDPRTRFMGYAGTWRLAGLQVHHRIEVSSHRYLIGSTQVRELSFAGELLVLSGSAADAGGPAGRGVLRWRPAAG
ncbi:lipocalin-like domain-containing protein [Saccharopolyspora sp. NPDC047091]|uniref:lipocalin-like domain-containing protein n=1 Tax=Saccharopolyspora sp. NPDC047091 TaxID=3155924 RepID=UPI0033F3B85D